MVKSEREQVHGQVGRAQAARPGQGAGAGAGVSAGEISALKSELVRQGAEIERLRSLVERLARELGVDPEAA